MFLVEDNFCFNEAFRIALIALANAACCVWNFFCRGKCYTMFVSGIELFKQIFIILLKCLAVLFLSFSRTLSKITQIRMKTKLILEVIKVDTSHYSWLTEYSKLPVITGVACIISFVLYIIPIITMSTHLLCGYYPNI